MGLVIYMPHQGSGSAYADILRISTLSAFAVAVPHIPMLFKIFKEIQEKIVLILFPFSQLNQTDSVSPVTVTVTYTSVPGFRHNLLCKSRTQMPLSATWTW